MNEVEVSWKYLILEIFYATGWQFLPEVRKRDGRLYIVGWNEEPLIMMRGMG